MKKKVKLLLIMLLLAVSSVLSVCAAGNTDSAPLYSEDGYYEVYNDMICFCHFNSVRTVTVGTALNGQTVMINYQAYTANGNIESGGNAGVGSTTMTFTASPGIEYIVITHSAPVLGISKSYTLYF